MLVIAFLLALVAIVLFLVAALTPKLNYLGFGLAVLTGAWMVQLIWTSGSKILVK